MKEPGIPVIYLLIPAFYPLIVWFYRSIQARVGSGLILTKPTSLSDGEVMSIAAASSVGAGLIHAAVMHPHYIDGFWTQLFFGVITVLQLIWAWSLFKRNSRPLLISGIAMNAAILLIWIQSRRAGLPIGPHPDQPETIGISDMIASALELIIIFSSVRLLKSKYHDPLTLDGRLIAPLSCIGITALGLIGFAFGGHH